MSILEKICYDFDFGFLPFLLLLLNDLDDNDTTIRKHWCEFIYFVQVR